MYFVSRIKFRGFKSFKGSEVTLPNGFVALAGPNGSGKSNVTDAIRFCLGEMSLKSLRAKKVAELININSAHAEVTMQIDGDRKFELKRTISEDGKTTYYLDGRHLTRAMALEALRPYGIEVGAHNIIAQGQVQRIVEMNPKERREIVDAAAGISEFEGKKREALGELAKVETKISEAKIVLSERGAYLAELEREKDAALMHMEAEKNLKQARATVLDAEYRKLDAHFSELVARKGSLSKEIERLGSKLAELGEKKAGLEAQRKALADKIGKSSERERILGAINELKVSIGQLDARIEERNKDLERMTSEQKEFEGQKERMLKAIKQFNEELSAQENKALEAKAKFEEAKKAAGIEDKEIKKAEIAEASDKLSRVGAAKAAVQATVDKNSQMKAQYLQLAKKAEDEAKKLEGAADDGKADKYVESIKSTTQDLDKLFEQEKKLNRDIPSLDKQLLEAKEKVATLRGSVSPAAQNPALLAIQSLKASGTTGIYGPVSELISVDEQYRVAIEAAAGGRLAYVVVKDIDVANGIIQKLKAGKQGRASFIPLDSIVLSERVTNVPQGALGKLIDFVDYSPEIDSAMRYMFEDTLLVSSVEAAKKIGSGRFRMVTTGGELLERSGVITGGSTHTSMMARASLAKAEAEVESIKSERDSLYSKMYEVRDQMQRLRRERADMELKLRALEAEQGSASQRHASIKKAQEELLEWKKKISELEDEDNQCLKKISEFVSQEQKLNSALDELKRAEEAEREQTKKKAGALADKYKQALEEYTELKGACDSKRRELEMLKSQSGELEGAKEKAIKLIKATKEQIASSNKERQEKAAERAGLEAELEEASATVKKYYDQMQKIQAELDSYGKEEGVIKFQFDKTGKEAQEVEVKQASAQARLVDLKAEWEKHAGIKLLDISRSEAERIISASEAKLTELGMVNQKAPEMYEQRKKELDEVDARVKTLESERAAVLGLIAEIEDKKRNIFLDTFKVVNTHFIRLFGMVYQGEGTLILEDPSNPLESGLSVRVRGQHDKKDKYLESMSGGEKSLIGMMFIFALQMHRPAPFYILDEAEAALDKENEHKFADFVKQMSSSAQFIVVTHSDAVLAAADVVLGVTKGVDGSKIVGVELTAGSPFLAMKNGKGQQEGSQKDGDKAGVGKPMDSPASEGAKAAKQPGSKSSQPYAKPNIPPPGKASGSSGLMNPALEMSSAKILARKKK